MGGASSIADASRDPIFLHEVPGKDKLMSALLNQSLKLTAGALKTRLRVDKLSLRQKKSTSSSRGEIRMLHLGFRVDRKNFLAAQEELNRCGVKFEFHDYEISHVIY